MLGLKIDYTTFLNGAVEAVMVVSNYSTSSPFENEAVEAAFSSAGSEIDYATLKMGQLRQFFLVV